MSSAIAMSIGRLKIRASAADVSSPAAAGHAELDRWIDPIHDAGPRPDEAAPWDRPFRSSLRTRQPRLDPPPLGPADPTRPARHPAPIGIGVAADVRHGLPGVRPLAELRLAANRDRGGPGNQVRLPLIGFQIAEPQNRIQCAHR
jgi:hypothetical protein